MPTYTMIVTVSMWAENQHYAHQQAKCMVARSTEAVDFIEAQITDTIHDDEPANVEVNK